MTSQNIDITNNPGISSLSNNDLYIAEDKGWNVIPLSVNPHAPTNLTGQQYSDSGTNWTSHLEWTVSNNRFKGTEIWESFNGSNYYLVARVLRENGIFDNHSFNRRLPITYENPPTDAYKYKLKAYSGNGMLSDFGNEIQVYPTVINLQAPTNLSGTVANLVVDLSWTSNSTNQTGFKIYRSIDGINYSLIHTNGNTTTYNDTTPNAGTYYYCVTAYNAYGESLPSNTISEATMGHYPDGKPYQPSGLGASPSYYNWRAGSNYYTRIDNSFSWSDNSDNETAFILQISLDNSSWANASSKGFNGSYPANTNSLFFMGNSEWTTGYIGSLPPIDFSYYYRIGATNSHGTSYSSSILVHYSQ